MKQHKGQDRASRDREQDSTARSGKGKTISPRSDLVSKTDGKSKTCQHGSPVAEMHAAHHEPGWVAKAGHYDHVVVTEYTAGAEH